MTGNLEGLIAGVRALVVGEVDTARLAASVGRLVSARAGAGLLADDQRRPRGEGVAHHVLHAEPDGSFALLALVWLPGQETPIHDHLCWCVSAVLEGEESETVYRPVATPGGVRLEVAARARNATGSVGVLVPPGDIHQVRNEAATPAISLHVYGADVRALGTSIRRCYPADLVHPATAATVRDDHRSAR